MRAAPFALAFIGGFPYTVYRCIILRDHEQDRLFSFAPKSTEFFV
jgi:hypothetical protein